MKLHEVSLQEAITLLRSKRASSVELVNVFLERIKKYNPKLHAFITVRDEQEIIAEATKADQERAKGSDRLLLGIPIVLKDNFLTQGLRTTAASKVLDDYIPQYDATAVSRLKNAGAIILGKTNLDAWGHGSSGEHTEYGITRNPYDYERVTGGSSSGSGAAVASDLCIAATGTDTGGSNRQPASYCNLVGLKPTYGRVSRYGIIAMASTTDSIGHLTKRVWDSAAILSVTAGNDPLDATSSTEPVQQYHERLADKGRVKIGIPKEFFEGLETKLVTKVLQALDVLKARGHRLIEISLPNVKYAYAIYCVTVSSEVSSNLARFDGIRYGFPRQGFQDEAKRRIMIGTHSLSAGYADQYYKRAIAGRTLLIREFEEAFQKVDLIAGPVFPFPPFKHGEREKDPLKMYLSDVLTVPANLTGHPAISVPIGFVDNLPNGLQLIAPHFSETRLFRVSLEVEQELRMYERKPRLKQ